MREIKFRGWNGETMLYYKSWFTLHRQSVLCFEKDEEHTYVDESDVDYPTRVELMQYTNLIDKNGKEIYEGDIVQYGKGYFYEIVFFNGSWCAKQKGSPTTRIYTSVKKKMFTVVGNIYSTPELLNK